MAESNAKLKGETFTSWGYGLTCVILKYNPQLDFLITKQIVFIPRWGEKNLFLCFFPGSGSLLSFISNQYSDLYMPSSSQGLIFLLVDDLLGNWPYKFGFLGMMLEAIQLATGIQDFY